jgi:hypothetical protein
VTGCCVLLAAACDCETCDGQSAAAASGSEKPRRRSEERQRRPREERRPVEGSNGWAKLAVEASAILLSAIGRPARVRARAACVDAAGC